LRAGTYVKTVGIILAVYEDGLHPKVFDCPSDADRNLPRTMGPVTGGAKTLC
jgi:hypothetical protein